MGRRINISQPTVINTELVPLTDSFALEPNGQTEQWYYENDGTYAPDRRIVPLVITPKLSAFDKDTNQTYSPNISTIAWYASRWSDSRWVETEITNISDASQDYYIRQDKALQVSKNISDAAHGVTIRCVVTFIDPRDAGITYTEEDTIQLTANKDATVFYPDVDILNETTVTFNPLIDENSHKVFKGKIEWASITRLNPSIAEYYVNPSGTEQTLPDNASDVTSLSPILDIRYGRGATVSWNQLFTYRQTAGGVISGNERTLTWNQLVQNGNFSNGTTGWSGSGFIADADGLELERNAYVGQAFPNYNSSHRYYLTAEGFGADAVLWVVVGDSSHSYSIGQIVMNRKNVLTRDSVIIEGECDNAILEMESMAGNSTVKYVMLVDLTLMYGAGNEPSTTEQFEEDFRTIFGKDIEYMPYNEGETVRIASLTEGTASVRRIQGQSVVWNQLVPQSSSSVATVSGNKYALFQGETKTIITGSGSAVSVTGGTDMLFDLTLMFGSGNEPATIEEFTTWLAASVGRKDYYEYNAGTILNVKSTGFKTTGFNQWDEEWESGSYDAYGENVESDTSIRTKNPIPIIGGVSYYFKSEATLGLRYYDSNGDCLSDYNRTIRNAEDTTPSNATYLRFTVVDVTTYNHDICINISDPNKNGTYEPYFESISPMEVTAMRGKLNGQGASNIVFQSGLNGIGGVFDEILTENDVLKAIKRIGMRAYESGDDNDDTVITNGTITCFELSTPEEYALDPIVETASFEWHGVKNGSEVKIETLPCYVSGQGTDTLTIDAMFGENIPIVLRAKRYPWSDSLYPSKAYRNMTWRVPNIDAIVASDRGQAVHSDNDGSYEFDTIINIKKAILDEETKNKHLRFKWWMRNTRNNQAVETNVGWGSQVGIGVEDLRNVRGANNSLASTPVYNEVMLLGAYEEISYTSGNSTAYVTYNGVQLFGRTLE